MVSAIDDRVKESSVDLSRDSGRGNWGAWRASVSLAIGVLVLGLVAFKLMLPSEATSSQPAPTRTVFVTPAPEVNKAAPPSPSPEPVPPPPNPESCAEVACVALTFDDGPSAYTPALLDKLKELEVKATFFDLGQSVANNPEPVKRAAEEGHELGGHSWNHTSMAKQTPEQACADADRTARAIRDAAGVETSLLRPPYGTWNDAILHACANKTFVLWDVDTLDWSTHDVAKITAHGVDDPKPGSIVLMHGTVAETVDALPGIVAGLRAKGYKLVTVSELFDSPLAPDQAIYSGPRTGVPAG
jgi:peptidoglycan/xylan/chitin deacetylase (PgdA/CDA1 family)